MSFSLALPQIIFLLFCSFFAGLIDSIAGGGGIITIPALLVVGVPPHLALGTNKLQSCFGSFTAAFHYSRKKLVSPKTLILGIITTFVGAGVGSLSVQHIDSMFLSYAIPFLLFIVFLFMLLSPKACAESRKPKLNFVLFLVGFGLGLGFYDGFFGPGTGAFWAMSLVFFMGMNLKAATAHTKVFNFTSNIASLLFFGLGGHVLLLPGLVMGIGQIIGSFLGSWLVIKKHVGFVRTFFLVVVGLTLLKLIYSTFFGS